MDFLQRQGYNEIEDNYNLVLDCIGKMLKSPEPSISEKIKFLPKDPNVVEDNNYVAICEFNSISIPNPKPIDPILSNAKKQPVNKKQPAQPVKITFEPYFYEKAASIPTVSDTVKVLGVNYSFEKMLRTNIIDCMLKVSKVEGDIEAIKADFEEFYSQKVAEPFVTQLQESIKKDKVVFENIEQPQDPQDSQEPQNSQP